jgi:hypothetical protein
VHWRLHAGAYAGLGWCVSAVDCNCAETGERTVLVSGKILQCISDIKQSYAQFTLCTCTHYTQLSPTPPTTRMAGYSSHC